MYNVGDKVMHRQEGACYITNIKSMEMGNMQKQYFVLEPILNKKTNIYISVDKQKQNSIRHVIEQRELKELEEKLQLSDKEWIMDAKVRNNRYTDTISTFDFEEVLDLYKCLILQNQKKSLTAKDKEFLFSSEKLLCSEIAILLDQEYDSVLEKIKESVLS